MACSFHSDLGSIMIASSVMVSIAIITATRLPTPSAQSKQDPAPFCSQTLHAASSASLPGHYELSVEMTIGPEASLCLVPAGYNALMVSLRLQAAYLDFPIAAQYSFNLPDLVTSCSCSCEEADLADPCSGVSCTGQTDCFLKTAAQSKCWACCATRLSAATKSHMRALQLASPMAVFILKMTEHLPNMTELSSTSFRITDRHSHVMFHLLQVSSTLHLVLKVAHPTTVATGVIRPLDWLIVPLDMKRHIEAAGPVTLVDPAFVNRIQDLSPDKLGWFRPLESRVSSPQALFKAMEINVRHCQQHSVEAAFHGLTSDTNVTALSKHIPQHLHLDVDMDRRVARMNLADSLMQARIWVKSDVSFRVIMSSASRLDAFNASASLSESGWVMLRLRLFSACGFFSGFVLPEEGASATAVVKEPFSFQVPDCSRDNVTRQIRLSNHYARDARIQICLHAVPAHSFVSVMATCSWCSVLLEEDPVWSNGSWGAVKVLQAHMPSLTSYRWWQYSYWSRTFEEWLKAAFAWPHGLLLLMKVLVAAALLAVFCKILLCLASCKRRR